jgi:Outer membrane protein beta-barrel domain
VQFITKPEGPGWRFRRTNKKGLIVIMKTFVKNVFIGLCITASIILVSSSLQAQVLAHSGDVAGYAGYLYVSNFSNTLSVCGSSCSAVSDNHGIYGANGGYNITPYVAVLGDFSYVPVYSGGGVTVSTELYGGGVRLNMNPNSKVVGYGIFTVGGDRLTGSESGSSTSVSGYSISFGGGASCYLGPHWGVRPEFRYLRPEYSVQGVSFSFNSVAMTGGVFYQWGGMAKRK